MNEGRGQACILDVDARLEAHLTVGIVEFEVPNDDAIVRTGGELGHGGAVLRFDAPWTDRIEDELLLLLARLSTALPLSIAAFEPYPQDVVIGLLGDVPAVFLEETFDDVQQG